MTDPGPALARSTVEAEPPCSLLITGAATVPAEIAMEGEHAGIPVLRTTIRTAAAIGNAVARALGARIRHLPLTRERIEATLLAQ